MEEIWKDIKGFENYQVSNIGRVKTKKRLLIRKNGVKFSVKEKIKSQFLSAKGYKIVSLTKNIKTYNKQVHQLVAIAFLNHVPCGHKIVVDHIDENKTNNHLSNLQLLTNRQNCLKSQNTKDDSSKLIGVSKKNERYHANIVNGKKRHFIGAFKTEKEASIAYEKALKQILKGKDVSIYRAKLKSKYKGISYNEITKRGKIYSYWIAYCFVDGKRINIGNSFKSEDDALSAKIKFCDENNIPFNTDTRNVIYI